MCNSTCLTMFFAHLPGIPARTPPRCTTRRVIRSHFVLSDIRPLRRRGLALESCWQPNREGGGETFPPWKRHPAASATEETHVAEHTLLCLYFRFFMNVCMGADGCVCVMNVCRDGTGMPSTPARWNCCSRSGTETQCSIVSVLVRSSVRPCLCVV